MKDGDRLPTWLAEKRESVWEWLRTLEDPERPGYFRWAVQGSEMEPSAETGLGASAMALKLVRQIGRMDDIPPARLAAWGERIKSFQQSDDGHRDGLFEDAVLLNAIPSASRTARSDADIRRAETRQACAALLGAGMSPLRPVRGIPGSPFGITRFVRGLPWNTDPWGSGSQTSHLAFFLKMNADRFGMRGWYRLNMACLRRWLEILQNRETGSWYRDDPPVAQKVNAAMKVLTVFDLLGVSFGRSDRLVDFCLGAINDEGACHHVDILYVLHECSKWTEHRRGEIMEFAYKRLDAIRAHSRDDGAFSFYQDRAGTRYYGNVAVSRGLQESDIHGTHLLVWAATLAADLLGFRDELGWQLPVT